MSWILKLHSVIGIQAEKSALKYLKKFGLKLLEKNFACSLGEIDLIMLDKKDIVFVEVRYRKQGLFGTAIESVTIKKQKKITATASFYLQKFYNKKDPICRFDVVALYPNNVKKTIETQWIQNAFSIHDNSNIQI